MWRPPLDGSAVHAPIPGHILIEGSERIEGNDYLLRKKKKLLTNYYYRLLTLPRTTRLVPALDSWTGWMRGVVHMDVWMDGWNTWKTVNQCSLQTSQVITTLACSLQTRRSEASLVWVRAGACSLQTRRSPRRLFAKCKKAPSHSWPGASCLCCDVRAKG